MEETLPQSGNFPDGFLEGRFEVDFTPRDLMRGHANAHIEPPIAQGENPKVARENILQKMQLDVVVGMASGDSCIIGS